METNNTNNQTAAKEIKITKEQNELAITMFTELINNEIDASSLAKHLDSLFVELAKYKITDPERCGQSDSFNELFWLRELVNVCSRTYES